MGLVTDTHSGALALDLTRPGTPAGESVDDTYGLNRMIGRG